MKKTGRIRYDLDKVYFMAEYNKAVAYGEQNIRVQGVKEQLCRLEQEKKNYFEKVADIVNAERDTEQAKYQRYEKWAANEKKAKYLEIALILATVLYVAFEKYFPNFFILFGFGLVTFVLLIGPISFYSLKDDETLVWKALCSVYRRNRKCDQPFRGRFYQDIAGIL